MAEFNWQSRDKEGILTIMGKEYSHDNVLTYWDIWQWLIDHGFPTIKEGDSLLK